MLGAPGRTQKKLHLLAGLGLNLLGEQNVSVVRKRLGIFTQNEQEKMNEWMSLFLRGSVCDLPSSLQLMFVEAFLHIFMVALKQWSFLH